MMIYPFKTIFLMEIVEKIYQRLSSKQDPRLDIKTQQKWKYEDKICIGCKTNEESGDEILLSLPNSTST
jgi:hypothetical protein